MSVSQPAQGVITSRRSPFGWRRLVLWAGFAAISAPTLLAIANQSWSTEQGQHGPIVLAIAAWLIWRSWAGMQALARPSSAWAVWLLGATAAIAYVLGRIADQIIIESYALYALGLVALFAFVGITAVRRNWFPLAYMVFALPMPFSLTWPVTSHLRLWITEAVVNLLQAFHLSVVRNGLTIFVDQYVLEVREACSGMNSLISLSAIGLFYVYIRHAGRWTYLALLTPAIISFAIIANFVRVLILVLLTHFYGDAVAQGYLHETAGLVTFAVAVLGVMFVDHLATRFASSRSKTGIA